MNSVWLFSHAEEDPRHFLVFYRTYGAQNKCLLTRFCLALPGVMLNQIGLCTCHVLATFLQKDLKFLPSRKKMKRCETNVVLGLNEKPTFH